MKIKLRSGRYVNGFVREVLEKYQMTEEQITSILEHQERFPELLLEHIDNEFVIDARNLWKQLEKPYSRFNDWMNKSVLKIKSKENSDYKVYDEIKQHEDLFMTFDPVRKIAYTPTAEKYDDFIRNTPYGEQDIKTFVRKYIERQPKTDFRFTVDFAKHVCMSENTDIGYKFRQYFIDIEKAFRKRVEWDDVRVVEKHNYIELGETLQRYSTGSDQERRKEANMLNRSLTGYSAEEIRKKLGIVDIWTRDHFDNEINKALDELQKFDIMLIQSRVDFDTRETMIGNLCVSKYSNLKGKIDSIAEKKPQMTTQ